METGGRSLGLGGELIIFAEPMLLHELQRCGHLFEVIHLGPPLIGRALPGAQAFLYIHNQINTPGHSGSWSVQLRQGALDCNYIPDLPRIKAFPEGGRAEPGGPLLPWHKDTAMSPDRIAGLLHEPQKDVKAVRAFSKGIADGCPQPFLVGGLVLRPQPRPVVEEAALAMELEAGDHREVIFQTHPVREPPYCLGQADEMPELVGAIQRSGVVVDVVMNVQAVCVSGNEKDVLALCPAHRRFIAHTVCLLRGDLSRLE